jgi:hypothetical protein
VKRESNPDPYPKWQMTNLPAGRQVANGNLLTGDNWYLGFVI